MEGHQLAIAMAGHHVRLEAQAAEQPQHADAGRPDRRLGHVGLHQFPPCFLARLVVEGRRREDERPQRRAAPRPDHPLEFLEGAADLREHDGELAQHARRLAPWPGKRNATRLPDHSGRAAKKTPRGSSNADRPAAIAPRAWISLSRRSSCEPVTIARMARSPRGCPAGHPAVPAPSTS